MPKYTNDHGLLVDASTDPPTVCGYMYIFEDKGIFAPDGKVHVTKAEADAHNKLLADAEWTAMLKHGKGLLYITRGADGKHFASDWPGVNKIPVYGVRKSFHNFAGKDGRTDVWFTIDDSRWHGVNIGDNQILRVKRLKKQCLD